ncbi:MAG: T9SS type A sorting domain-containing protein [Bacteroidetes bacterium]|nr:T9SS type A sorting domain-containing protein [Bacteroidota bacterium]
MYTTLDADSVAHFIFPDIYLADSTTDEPASHGFVVYTIKPKPGLDYNTLITNNAGIYFDFNEPVITNTVSNTVVDSIPVFSTNQHIMICEGDSVEVGNSIYFTPGTYTDVLESIDGCDSIVHTTIENYFINTEITIEGNTLLSQQEDALYQWIDCNVGNTAIDGETSSTFEPGISGNYAVIINTNGCLDTTACIAFTFNAIGESDAINQMVVYPTPATNEIVIQSESIILNFNIISMDGITIMAGEGNFAHEQHIIVIDLLPAMYIISVQTNQGVGFLPFLKQ